MGKMGKIRKMGKMVIIHWNVGYPIFRHAHMAVCQTWVSSNHPVVMDDHDLALNPTVTTEDPRFYETPYNWICLKIGYPKN